MSNQQKVTITQLASVIGKSVETIRRNIKAGNIPPADGTAIGTRTFCWHLSTLSAWNPAVSKRLESLLASDASREVF